MTPVKNGTIIILNGNSSTGKSTLATQISNLLEDSVVIRCDEVCLQVFKRLIDDNHYVLKNNHPQDLLSLLYASVPEIESDTLDDLVNKEMYKQIRMHADLGKTVINDNAWVRPQDKDDCKLELQGYRIFHVFAHCCLDDLLMRVKKRNLYEDKIEHRSITLPFRILPLIYRPQESQEGQIVDRWKASAIQEFMNKLKNEFDLAKHTYNQFWLEDDNRFFSSEDNFISQFKLDVLEEVSIGPKFPFDFLVNTTTSSKEECARQIIEQLKEF